MDGMFNIQDIDEKVTNRNRDKMEAIKVGSLRSRVIQVNGSTLNILINKVKYLLDLCANLFSVNKEIKNEFDLSNKVDKIFFTKESASITFDRIIKSLDGKVSGIKIISLDFPADYVAQSKLNSINSIDVSIS
jgi:hypothetical protein